MDLTNHPNPNFDLTLLNEIADGSPEFLVETFDLFLDQVPQLLGEIGSAINREEWETTHATAHKLKSTLGMFGMNESFELMQKIDQTAKKQEMLTELPDMFDQAKKRISSTYADITALRDELKQAI